MKSGLYYTNPKREKSIKPLNPSFKYTFTIKWSKMAIIILVFFAHPPFPPDHYCPILIWLCGDVAKFHIFKVPRFQDSKVPRFLNFKISKSKITRFPSDFSQNGWHVRYYRTTNVGYGTTNTDAGVGIGLKRGIRKFDKKIIDSPIRPLISRK